MSVSPRDVGILQDRGRARFEKEGKPGAAQGTQ